MANTQSMCTSFMSELMYGYHQFGAPTLTSRGSLTTPTNDTFKGALYLASATLNASTTAYSSTDVLTTIKAQLKDAQGPPNCIGWEDSQNDVTSAVQKYLFGSTSAKDALDAAAEAMKSRQ